MATASSLGSAFYGFALVLLPTLAFVGFVTFERALQLSIEDTEYARRIALLRGYYFGHAPEIAPCLLSVPPAETAPSCSECPAIAGRGIARSPAWSR